MTKGSDSREFFEIFKPIHTAEDVQKSEVTSQEESTEGSRQPKPFSHHEKSDTKPAPASDPLG